MLLSDRRQSRPLLPVVSLLLAGMLFATCRPAVVRVPGITPEDIRRANQLAFEGDLAFARKDFYAALIKYIQASERNPNSHIIYNKLGIAYSQLKFYDRATHAFERSIGLDRKYAYSYNNLGSVYFAADNKKKAEKYFKKAISLKKDVASFHINLGTLLFERKQFDKGLEEWRKGLALDPDIMRKSQSVSLVAAGREKNSEKSYFLARLYASQGDAELAVESLQKALEEGFTDIEAIRSEHDFDSIRSDERFVAFMKTADLMLKP